MKNITPTNQTIILNAWLKSENFKIVVLWCLQQSPANTTEEHLMGVLMYSAAFWAAIVFDVNASGPAWDKLLLEMCLAVTKEVGECLALKLKPIV
jgi:hypothetical protein